jgi:hypothetical protein
MKYARSIWSQFEDNLRSAAYTSSLSKFLGAVCQRLGIEVSAKELGLVDEVITSGEDRDVLGKLRNETTYLVLLVRLRNEERKEEFAAARAAKDGNEKENEKECSRLFSRE